jgi:two-component system, sensor histidine kinase and response regulator
MLISDMKNPSKRILVVDDQSSHRLLLMLLCSQFLPDQVILAEASNGEEAILLAQQWRPHLILMDLRMPKMDGYEAIQHIRAFEEKLNDSLNQQHFSKIHIIAVSADVFKSSTLRAFDAGCDDFVAKPYLVAQLSSIIQKRLAVAGYPSLATDQLQIA